MVYQKYSEEELLQYLRGHANIENFFITSFDSSSSGLINFFDAGKAWCLMEDDDVLVSDAIVFLKIRGAPIFSDLESSKEHVEKLKSSTAPSADLREEK